MENKLAEAVANPQSLSTDTAPAAKEPDSKPMPERTEAPLDKEYLDKKIKLNKPFKDKRDKSNAKGEAAPKKTDDGGADASAAGKGEAAAPEETDGTGKADKRNDPEWLKVNNPERYSKLYNADGTRKSTSELATERMEKAKKEAAEIKSEYLRLEAEYKQALADKDVVTQKLIERETKELEQRSQAAIADRFYAEAEEQLGSENMDSYRDLMGYYSPKLREIPNFESILKNYSEKHKILMHIAGFIDSSDNPSGIIEALKGMPERQLSKTIRQVDEELKRRASDPDSKKAAAPAAKVPDSVVATTPSETEIPEKPKGATRKEALEHFRKYGKDFKKLLEESNKR
jgi:hypothetical protein